MARDVGVIYGGTQNPINRNNLHKAYKSLTLINEKHMKKRLNDVSMDNWMYCIDTCNNRWVYGTRRRCDLRWNTKPNKPE